MPRVLLFSPLDQTDKKSWSGGLYPIWQQLQQHFDVETVGPIKTNLLGRIIWKFNVIGYKLFGKKFDDGAIWLMRKNLQWRLRKRLKEKQYDAIVVVAAYAELLALPTSGTPIIFYSDATQRLFTTLYPGRVKKFFSWSNRLQIKLEQKAYSWCSLLVFTSQWAADSAINEYGQSADKVRVLPYGANVVPDNPVLHQLPVATEPVWFLFPAVDWARKGGDKAVAIVAALRAKGIPAILQVVGCEPPLPPTDYIERIGFVNRNTAEGEAFYKQLFTRAHFLLLPTTADCTPFVFCEAFAFSLPVITHDVGGIKEMIAYLNAGLVYGVNTDASIIAEEIAAVIANKSNYDHLCLAARESYEQQFNWDHWGRQMTFHIEEQFVKHRTNL